MGRSGGLRIQHPKLQAVIYLRRKEKEEKALQWEGKIIIAGQRALSAATLWVSTGMRKICGFASGMRRGERSNVWEGFRRCYWRQQLQHAVRTIDNGLLRAKRRYRQTCKSLLLTAPLNVRVLQSLAGETTRHDFRSPQKKAAPSSFPVRKGPQPIAYW